MTPLQSYNIIAVLLIALVVYVAIIMLVDCYKEYKEDNQ